MHGGAGAGRGQQRGDRVIIIIACIIIMQDAAAADETGLAPQAAMIKTTTDAPRA